MTQRKVLDKVKVDGSQTPAEKIRAIKEICSKGEPIHFYEVLQSKLYKSVREKLKHSFLM